MKLKPLLKEELEFGTMRLLMPVFFGIGVLLYFLATDEPNVWVALFVTLTIAALYFTIKRLRYKLILFVLMLISAGFTGASLRAILSDHPVLSAPTRTIDLTGRIEKIERRENNDRVTLYIHEMTGQKLERVRVVSRERVTFKVGDDVSVKARLLPPSPPSRPGGYNFARDSWFNELAAVGFTLGDFTKATPRPLNLTAWFQIKIENVRTAISTRIRYALAGETGAFADALVTGRRDGISVKTQDALRAAGTYHILSISGFHMTLVAAFIFACVRGLFAFIPSIAQKFNVKAFAGAVAFSVAGFYNLLAGSEVATVRSWLMIALVLLGVMLARAAFTLHTLSTSALIILIFAPETLLSPSFQMSFAATLVLVAGYKGARLSLDKYANEGSLLQKMGASVTSGITGLASASLFAGLATLPFTAWHFHQIQAYGLFGNLIGGPIVEFFVMPLIIIALLLWSFGFDLLLYPFIGKAIDLFLASAHWIGSWPGNSLNVPIFSGVSLGIGALGFVILLVLKTRLKLIGFAMMAGATLTAFTPERPFLLADASGTTIAVLHNGILSPISEKPVKYVLNEWQQAYGAAAGKIAGACDALGCIYSVKGLSLYAPKTASSYVEECLLNDIIITQAQLPAGCKGLQTASTYYKTGEGFRVDNAHSHIGSRYWQKQAKGENVLSAPSTVDIEAEAAKPD
jgi:competence protein ComEC